MTDPAPHSGTTSHPWIARLLLVAFVLACLGHLWGLYSPQVELPSDAPNSDKWAHLIGFGVPVALGWLRFRRRRWLVVGLFAAHTVVSELVQHWVLPGRTGDPTDALADLGGVALGVLIGSVCRWASRATSQIG